MIDVKPLKVFGGDEGDRTPGLGIANAALSQLSYIPWDGPLNGLNQGCIFYYFTWFVNTYLSTTVDGAAARPTTVEVTPDGGRR